MLQSILSNSFKANVLDLAPVIIAVHDTDHNIVWANKAYQKATGKFLEEMEGTKCYVIWNLSRPCKGCPVLTAIETGEEQEAELTPENQDYWPATQGSWLSKAAPLRDADGTTIGAIETAYEITERKHMENELKKFKTISDKAGHGITIVDLEGNVNYVNTVFAEMHKYTADELIGKHISIFHTKEQLANVNRLREKLNREGSFIGEEVWHKRKDNVEFLTLMTGTLVKDETEHPWLMAGTAIDITERKRAEEALRESESRYRAFFEKGPDGVVIMNLETTTFIEFNDQVCRQLGYSREEFAQLRMSDIDVKETAEKTKARIREIVDKGYEDFETLQRTKQGEIRHVHVKAQIVEIMGNPVCHCIWRDITERKRMEEEILKTEKLESLGILAGGIAHDFNNTLTTILGNVSMAKDQAVPKSEIFELLSEAEAASKRAQKLTKQLLTFAKGGTPVKETASFGDIIRESSLFVIHGSRSGCEFSIAEDLWPMEVDVGQVSQVINNIVINADQAMPEGGIIKIKAENLIIDEGNEWQLKPGRYVRMSVKDEGIGISKKHLSKVFDPYFTTKQEGSGLGLATTYSIIKKHDGHINVESQLGIGTIFHIYLPAIEKTGPEKWENKEIKEIEGRGKILVMDDEASLRKIVGRMLEKLGYEPEFAKDGAEAIGMYKAAKEAKRRYDAVILDLTIPGGIGGEEAIQKLLEIDPEVKAIVSSGYYDDPVLANFQEYGFKGMMTKPFELLSLSKVLDKLLKGEKE